MKDTEFVVNAFRKGMSIEEMNGFAHGLSAQYAEGYGHHEGFDAGDLAIVVMKRDIDVEACSAPDSQAVAETLDRALQQANQTIEYLRNEGAVLRQQLADKMTVEDAKTLANVAYNRAKHLPCEDCTQQDFEDWWTEYRKENGFVVEPKADAITADEVLPRIKALAMRFFGWAHEWMQWIVSEQDKSIQLFHTLVADEYELELNIEATNQGLRLFEISRLQYLEKVAQAVADALNK